MESFNSVLIPTDGSEDATYAARKGLSLAKLINAKKVIALYVKDLVSLYGVPEDDMILFINANLENEGNTILSDIKNEGKELGLDVETVILEGHPADEILQVAEDRGVDIIVMGTVGRSGITCLLMGSVAEKVTRHAPCPVLVVRYKEGKRNRE